jgi:hypothetical protein
MGETRVDLAHLLEDLRDAYPGTVEETILTEIVANGLDSGATAISFALDPAQSTLTVADNGSGMTRRELTRYHDIATSAKVRGQGIGFAGVGIKLGLLASDEVVTETRRGSTHVASTWRLASRHRAPWKRIPPPGVLAERGTAVRLKLGNPLSPLLDAGFVETTIERAFHPLLDSGFAELLRAHYPHGVRFVVNGRELPRREAPSGAAPLSIRVGRKRKPSAVGYLVLEPAPLSEDERGVAVSTLGKVIKRGWDWLGLAPSHADRIRGLIEVPALADCLSLNKADFIRVGRRGMSYLAYRKAMQEAVSAQLAGWGDAQNGSEDARRRKTRPLERDLQTVLVDLAEDFPLLASLVERHAGGQRRLAMAAGEAIGGDGGAQASITGAPQPALDATARTPIGDASGTERSDLDKTRAPEAAETATSAAPPPEVVGSLELPGGRQRRRPGHYGLTIQIANRPGDHELARLVDSTVWVNETHPAYRRAAASRSEGYHLAVAVAMALAPLAAEPKDAHGFVTAFLARWGEAIDRPRARRR